MRILITGGAGFIGYHLARDRLKRFDHVTILDNFSRVRSAERYWLLKQEFGSTHLNLLNVSILSEHGSSSRFDCIFHLAAQTAVTRSIDDPVGDFMDNCFGTIGLLDTIRRHYDPYPKFIYASTNKVYGPTLRCIPYESGGDCRDRHPHPIDEAQPVDLRTPYGISKGAADFYVQEYGRLYGLPTVVLRQSCIYGPQQTAEADQGWLAHFVDCILRDIPFTIFGTGHQTRDILHVDDLVELYDQVLRGSTAPGEVFNVGGGPENKVSLLQAIDVIERASGMQARYTFDLPRLSDQERYVSDIRKVSDRLQWKPKIVAAEGIRQLVGWWGEEIFK